MPRFLSASFFVLALSLAQAASAQITGVGNDQAPPTPGVGHDYIHFLTETVNPANGSLSVRIEVPVPKGRGLSIPFAFAYDSNGIRFPQSAVPGAIVWKSSNSYLSQGGWSYSFPNLTMNLLTLEQQVGNYYYTCPYTTSYVFHDANGSAHGLGMSSWQAPVTQCELMNSPPPNVLTGADGFVYATSPSAVTYQGGGITPVTLEDLDGTVYYFPLTGGLRYSAGSNQGTTFPAWVEDRNGNQALISDNGGGAITVTDTAGRAELKSSGFGVTGNTLTVAGLANPYTLTWGSSAYNYTVPYVQVSVLTCGTAKQPASGSSPTLQTLELPNGQSYKFYYETTYGLINEIVYPSGGWVKYTWGMNPTANIALFANTSGNQDACAYQYGQPVVTKRQVSYDGTTVAEEQDFNTYGTTWNGTNNEYWTTKNTTVTTKELVLGSSFNTAYIYSPVNAGNNDPTSTSLFAPQAPVESQVSYYNWNGSLLRTVNETWNSVYELATKKVTLNDISPSQTSEVAYSYDPTGAVLVSEKDEYDYGKSTPSRKTVTNYATFADTPLYPSGPSIQNRPSSVIVYNVSGTRAAETDYAYDQSAIGSVSATTQHDETHYGPSSTAARGNATTVTKQCFPSCTNAVTTYTYDETGQAMTMTDPNGNTTGYSFADSYTSGTPPGNTNAYLTKITRPVTNSVSHISNYSYGYEDGQLTVAKDENGQSTTYVYADSLDRLTAVSYPDTGHTSYTYNDAPPTPSVTTTKLATPSPTFTSVSIMDGVGHVTQNQVSSVSPSIFTVTKYDGLGHSHYVYNATGCSPPTTNCGESTWGYSTYAYDGLGRTVSVAEQDGSSISTAYSGNTTTVTDEAGHQRKTVTDGLDRLTSVVEAPAGFNFLTTYSYDLLDDLIGVVQDGSRNRTFAYDSLARLTSATNPESGTISYSYDPNGNVATRRDARGTMTTYTNDALNRVTQKVYSDGTIQANFGYDASAGWGVSLLNGVGRITEQWTGTASNPTATLFSYDPMGRVAFNILCTPLYCPSATASRYSTAYTYDLAGDMLTASIGKAQFQNLPNGLTISYQYDGAMRATTVTSSLVDAQHPATLVSGIHYAPNGATSQITYGNGLTASSVYNPRLQPCRSNVNSSGAVFSSLSACGSTSMPTGNVLDLQYSWNAGSGDNGNLVGTAVAGAQTYNRTYSYDQLNRLSSMSGTGGLCTGLNWSYDPWGNRTSQTQVSGTCLQQPTTTITANNQFSGYGYDAAGNMTSQSGATYTYDAENRLSSVSASGGAATYTYDASGLRAGKTVSGALVDYLHDTQGNVISEVVTTDWSRANVYLSGRMITVYANGTAYFVTGDPLGSTRLLTTTTGGVEDCNGFYPYGEQDAGICTSNNTTNKKFTGKERDSESNLDNFEARYMASSLGRFMSPDPGNISGQMNRDDPQSWNGYSYARNNPLLYTDPDGETYRICTTDEYGNTHCTDVSDSEFDEAQNTNGQGGNYLKNGSVYYTDQSGNQVQTGTYVQTSMDLNPFAQSVGSQLNRMPIQKFIAAFAVGSTALGASGGTLCYVFCESAPAVALGGESGLDLVQGTRTLNQMLSAGQRQLLREFFETGERPNGLTERSLQIYKEIAKRAIAAGRDELGVQAQRLQMISNILK